MKVLKFGGTSVGSSESLHNVKSIVENDNDDLIVVVSALGGITNRLIEMANKAANGDISFRADLKEVAARHADVICHVVPSERQQPALQRTQSLLDDLSNVLEAILCLGELTSRSLMRVESFGERISSFIVSSMFDGAMFVDSLELIRTTLRFDKNVLNSEATNAIIDATFAKRPRITVCGGFISRDSSDGYITNLGRGGSDYTAAIIAARLHADVLEIWTDVDGFMTADPRVVSSARIIDRMSFVEAMELCNFGAKVIYPPTIYPVFNANIPILIKNTFNPTAPGTLIWSEGSHPHSGVTGVSAISSTCLLSLAGAPDSLADRMINSLTRNGIETILPTSHCLVGVQAADAARAVDVLSEKFASELADGTISRVATTDGLSTIALVGASANLAAQLIATLNGEGIPVIHEPVQTASGTLACMIPSSFIHQALRAIHSSFIEL